MSRRHVTLAEIIGSDDHITLMLMRSGKKGDRVLVYLSGTPRID